MNLIAWNYMGFNVDNFRRNFGALIDYHKPYLVALVETKMQDYISLHNKFPFNNMIQVLANSNSGGLVRLWDDEILELDDITTKGQEIYVMVKVRSTNHSWLFSSIYAGTYRNSHNILWQNHRTIFFLQETGD